jgi:hypothetical protein
VAFTATIFTKLANAQWDDVVGSCITFHPHPLKNGTRVYKLIYALMCDFPLAHLHETHASSTPFCKEPFIGLYKNLTNILK